MMDLFRYFSLVFSYPTEETLQELGEISRAADFSGPLCEEELKIVSLQDAQAEYTRLFISAFPRLLCPPYESYYREGVVYGNASVEVRELYEKHGLRFGYEGEPPDLFSAELEFLALTNDEIFLERMKEWVFDFTSRVREHSKIYGRCAEAFEDFIRLGNRI